jgi:hypothetical protein
MEKPGRKKRKKVSFSFLIQNVGKEKERINLSDSG